MAVEDILEFHDVTSEVKGALCRGRLKFTDQSVIFKNSKTGKVDQLSHSDIEFANWLKLVGSFGVRLYLKNGALHRFLGFKEAERDKIARYFKQTYSLDMLEKEMSVKGWNWGTAKFTGSVLSFDINNVPAFEMPLANVSQCTTGKNEVTLEFHQNDDAPVSLMEMRFHIPSSELAGDADPVEAFHDQVMKQASVISVSGDAIAIFREIHCLTPRGRYDIKIFPAFFQLHGKTFDYKVPMSTVIRLFILPHKDQRQHFLVVSLDPPIKQGQTRYHYLVLLFNQDDETSLELPFTEEELKEKYEDKITKELSGPTYEVLGKIMKVLVNRKITAPGAFKGHSGTPAIGCSYKAAAGYIYPLERGFIYIHKPPIHIRFEEISNVNFARSGGSTRSFDFEIELKNGNVYTFSSIEKEEYGKLYDFINSKKLRVKNRGKTDVGYNDDFGDSDEEGAPDAYLERVKREAEENDDGDEEEDESTDEDFKPPKEDESEVDDEFDSNAESSESGSGSGSESESKPKKEIKPEKKEKSEKKESHKSTKSSSDKPKKIKKDKDSGRPKRPPSAYMLWFNDIRETIKSENPGITFTEIGKKGGELWKKMTSSEKEVWDKKAAEAKEEYVVAMKKYEKSGGGSSGHAKESPEASKKQKSKVNLTPSKSGTGSKYVSKEFIEDDDSSSDSDSAKKTNEKKPVMKKMTENVKDERETDDSDAEKSSKRKKEESSSEEEKKKKKKTKSSDDEDESDDSESEEENVKRKKNEQSSSDEENKRSVKKIKTEVKREESESETEEESAESTPATSEED